MTAHVHRIGGIPANAVGQAPGEATGVQRFLCNVCGEPVHVLIRTTTVQQIA